MSKIDVSGWKEFKVTNLLNWYHGRRRKRNDLDLVDFKIKPDLVGYLTAGFENQGAIGSCSPTMFSDETDAIFNRSITIDMFGNSFFHTYPCAGDDNVYFLTSNKYSDNQMLFLTGIINSITSSKFGYNDQFRQHNLETLTIKLPVTSTGEPDWDYMDEYIEKLATQARKNVSSLATLKPVEHKIDIKAWKEFKVGELFDVRPSKYVKQNGKTLINAELFDNGDHKVIVNTSTNNGIGGYTSQDFTEDGNVITFSDTTDGPSTMFYQDQPFVGYSHVKVMEPIDNIKNSRNVLLYLTATIRKALSLNDYNFTNKLTTQAMNNTSIKLPVTSTGQPDFDYMEKYIDNVQNKVHESLELLKQI